MEKVIVKVRGQQTDAAGETDKMEVVAEGRHYYRNGKHYVVYSEDAKQAAKSSTMLKIAPDSMILFRKGEIAYEQFFQKDREVTSEFNTPYGTLDLSVKTRNLEIVYGTTSGNIDIDYALSIDGKWQADHELHIEIEAHPDDVGKLN